MNGGTPAGAPLRTPTQSPARKKQKPRSPAKGKTVKAARASANKRSHKSPRDAQVVKQQYKNMRIWEMLERYGVITDCKDLNSLEKFIKAGQLGAVTQAKHLEQMSAALKDRADQFDRRIEEVNKRIAEYNQMKQQEQIELRRLQGLQQPSEQLTMYLERQDAVIVKQTAFQPPPIKSRKKKIKSGNVFIACAARSPLDLGGRESPKTWGSLHFLFSRCGVKVDDDGEYIIYYDNANNLSSFLHARHAPPSQL